MAAQLDTPGIDLPAAERRGQKPRGMGKIWGEVSKNPIFFSRWHSNQLVGAGPVVFQLKKVLHRKLGGGFKYFLFSPLFREDFQFD